MAAWRDFWIHIYLCLSFFGDQWPFHFSLSLFFCIIGPSSYTHFHLTQVSISESITRILALAKSASSQVWLQQHRPRPLSTDQLWSRSNERDWTLWSFVPAACGRVCDWPFILSLSLSLSLSHRHTHTQRKRQVDRDTVTQYPLGRTAVVIDDFYCDSPYLRLFLYLAHRLWAGRNLLLTLTNGL